MLSPLRMCLTAFKAVMDFGAEAPETEQNNNERKMIRRPLPTDTDKWNSLPEVPRHADMGYLHLSFEYHKGALKVRVWQISDLLLPPPQISMIHSIFVRGYFMPDNVRKTLRRTEEIILDPPGNDKSVENAKTGIQHIFTPSSFKFRTPLTYVGVTSEIVQQRSLQLEVCMTQKRSQRVFLMAMVHMPLRTAVRRPIRQKYPLIPCMNVTIPNNMRVYSAVDLQLESSRGDYYQRNGVGTSPKRKEANGYMNHSGVPLSPQEIELDDAVSLSADEFLRSHLALCLDDSDEDDQLAESTDSGGLREIRIDYGVGSSRASSSTTLDVPSSEEDENDDDIPTAITNGQDTSSNSSATHTVSMPIQSAVRKKVIPNELLRDNESFEVAMDLSAENSVLVGDSDSSFSQHSSYQETCESELPTSKPARRKIIPLELVLPASVPDPDALSTNDDFRALEEGESLTEGSSPNHMHSLQSNRKSTPAKPPRRKTLVSHGDSSNPLDSSAHHRTSMRVSSVSEGLSPHETLSPGGRRDPRDLSPLQDSAFTPASRPETPCWDFYDFSEDLQAGKLDLDVEAGGRSLEESLEQLRQHGIGSLQNLSMDPILPMDLVDDFDTLVVESQEAEDAAKEENNT